MLHRHLASPAQIAGVVVWVTLALSAVALAQDEPPELPECPIRDGKRGHWSYIADTERWVVRPLALEVARGGEMAPGEAEWIASRVTLLASNDPVHPFFFSLEQLPGSGPTPADLRVEVVVDGRVVHKASTVPPDASAATLALEGDAARDLIARLEAGEQATFWFSTGQGPVLKVVVDLDGMAEAARLARAGFAESVAALEAGECDPWAWLE